MEIIPNQQKNQGAVAVYPNYNATTGTLIAFDKIKEMAAAPAETAKNETALIVPTDAPSKTKELILKHNKMALLWIDIDSGDKSLNEVVNVCKTHGLSEVVIYSTSTAKREKNGVTQGRRWRVVICLADSLLNCEHWLILQAALARIFQGGAEAVRIQQGFFAPTNPDGGYYEYQIIDGNPLDPANLPALLLECVNQIVQEDQALKEAATKAPEKSRDVSGNAGTVIDMVNAAYSLESVMNCAYIEKGRNKYLYRNSTSGTPGATILDGGKRMFSHHQSDPLCDGFSHDAFDVLCFHQFNGDISKAVAHFAGELDPEGQKQRRLEHVKSQSILTPAPHPESPAAVKSGSLFESASDFLTETVKVEYLVRNLIEVHSLVSITGPSGQYKSFVAVDFGCCFVSGRSWNGRTVKRGAILYLAGEGRGGIKRRIKAWCIANNLALSDMRGFYLSRNTLMMDGSNIEQIVAEMAGVEVVAIFIDTTARHIPGNENDSRDMGAYINAVDALRSRLRAVAIMVHHTGHDTTRGRGSTVYRAALDTEIMCDKSQLVFSKTKDAEPPAPMEFKLVPVEIGADEDGEVITSCVVMYGEHSERSKLPKFTRNEAVAIRALVEVAAKEKRIINEMYAGNTEAWREHFYTIRKLEEPDVKQEALKKGFQNVIIGLIRKNALAQVSTDSILEYEEHQERINAINLGDISITLQRENGKFPGLFPAV